MNHTIVITILSRHPEKPYTLIVSKRSYLYLGISLWVLTVVFVAAPIWPYVFYRLSPGTSEVLASTIGNTVKVSPGTVVQANRLSAVPIPKSAQANRLSAVPIPKSAQRDSSPVKPALPLPLFDPSLPKENGLLIEKIGVRGEIHEGENWAEILKTGVWRVPDFGTPEDDGPSEPVERGADSQNGPSELVERGADSQIGPSELVERGADSQIGLPIILAAHRFGYVTWTNSFRTLNSFYSLPKLKVGDRVEIVWNQRKYVYEIYKEETGTAITDYTADLILYTCDLWNSPTRIFKYARRSATK